VEDALTVDLGHLSLNMVVGIDKAQTLKLRALAQNKIMLILVDSGSTHNFVNTAFVHKSGLRSVHIPPLEVKVASGETLVTNQSVPQLEWWTQGYTFHIDTMVLDLGPFDAILGYDWLDPLSPMVCHWNQRTLDFHYKG
jgi:hypothetical protein